MEIKRDRYLNKLISFMWDGQVKVITGIRRCGKSYLLRNLFRTYLFGEGVPADHILSFELDLTRDIRYRNPLELANRVREIVENQREQFYLFVDEIQMSDEVPNPYNPDGKKITFYDALNDLKSLSNLDIYVTGSNSRMLSSDILTEFRGRSDEIRVHPLSFAEYYSAVGGDKEDAFENYAFYGGMPLILSRPTDAAKMQYLSSLFSEVYLKDIVERKKVKREDVLSDILDLLCSSVGSLTNPTRVADTINSKQKRSGENTVSPNTVKAYMDHLADAFLFTECKRWDVKGKNYFDYAGVCVQSGASATGSPQLSLAVNGGSLTASGGGNNDGIQFYVGNSSASATTSLTVSENAIVDARNGGISALKISETLPTPTPTGNNSSGIVFDGENGTVYGNVTLDESLTINQGETLTIPEGSSLDMGGNEITVASGGKLDGTPTGGTVVYGPTITKQPEAQSVTAGNTATFTVAASGSEPLSYKWQYRTNSGTNWNDIPDATDNNYTTEAVTLDMNNYQYQCVVSNSAGSVTSNAATLTVNAATVPVTGVKLDQTELSLYTGESKTLIATVQPSDATDKTVTWTSSNPSVATVENGVVTAVAPGTAVITVTTADGGKTASCTVTVTVPVTGVSLNKTSTSLYVGDTETLTATVEPSDATNKNVTWRTSDASVATVTDGVVTALARGTAVITATTADGGKTASCTVTVSRYSSGGGSSSSSTSLSDRAIDDIQDARPGDTVEITLRPGRTTLEREVFEELAGQDITLEIDAGDGVLWTVNGLDIPEDTRLHDLDLDVDLGDSDIPATVLNAVTGEISTVQLSLAHDGEFGFTMTLSAPLGRDNADYWANLYWYNERTEELEFQQAARIARDGTAEFALDHASDYAIVIDDRSHEPVDLPFNDVPEGYWAYDAIQYVYGEGLMAGTSGSTFSPEGTTTRGQIVTILWRLSGSPVVNYLMDFDDVDPAAYYGEAIRWAASEGIAGGYGNGSFGPDDPITREQLAVMLHRYAQHQGYDVSIGEDTNILSYADAFDVSEYAVSALQWACGAGIISGTGDGSTLTPQGEATRAQAATVLMRFCNMYGNP